MNIKNYIPAVATITLLIADIYAWTFIAHLISAPSDNAVLAGVLLLLALGGLNLFILYKLINRFNNED